MNEIWQMNGYGSYVWSAYGITLLVFVINVITSFQQTKKVKQKVRELDQDQF